MGRVYLARDLLEKGREVALKLYPPGAPDERLAREFTTLRALRHPGIARAYHCGRNDADDSLFFTMEYIRGEPLDAFLERADATNGPADLASCVGLFLQVARALAHLHRRGILHLDLKPENILVVRLEQDSPPRAVLIDFGLVRLTDSSDSPVQQGTAPFVAPELFRGETPGPAYDVYSLGITFHSILSGRLPFVADDIDGYCHAHLLEAPPDLEGVPPALAGLVSKCLAKDPALRFRDGDDVASALAALRIDGAKPISPPLVFHEPELVGRQTEIETLERWLSDDDARRSPIVVEAPPGSGKTRLLESFETSIEVAARPVLRLDALESGGDLISESLRRIEILFGPLRASGPQDRLLLALAGVRKYSSRTRELQRRSTAGDLRSSLIRFAARHIAERVRSDGTIVLVDDLDHAGSASRELVFELLAELERGDAETRVPDDARSPGGVVLAHSSAGGSALTERIDKLEVGPLRLTPAPLTAKECAQIEIAGLEDAAAELSQTRVRELKILLHEETGGHPFFFIRGLLRLPGAPPRKGGLPRAARLDAEVSHLDEELRAFLTTLAALGRPASISELTIFLDATASVVERDRERLRQRGLLTPSGTACRLIHQSVADAVVQQADESDIVDAHVRIADALVADSPTLLEAASHYLRGERAQRGIEACFSFLDTPTERGWGDEDRAAETFVAAAETCESNSDARLRLLESAGDFLENDGRFEECRDFRTQVVELRDRSRDVTTLRALVKLATALHRLGETARARELLDECLELVDDVEDCPEIARVFAEKAVLCHWAQESDEALRLALEGLERWNRVPEKIRHDVLSPTPNLYSILGQIHIRRLEGSEALRWLEEGVDVASRSIAPGNTAILLNNLGLALHMESRFADALKTFARAEKIARELRTGTAVVTILLNVAQIEGKRGRLEAARQSLRRAGEEPSLEQSKRLQLSHAYTRAFIDTLEGVASPEDWEEVERAAGEAGDAFLLRFTRLYRAEVSLEHGQWAVARALLRKPQDESAGESPLEAARLSRLALVESLSGNMSASAAARRDHAKLGENRQLLADWNEIYLGAAALEEGHLDVAQEHLCAAESSLAKSEYVIARLECVLRLADLALRRGNAREAQRWARIAKGLRPARAETTTPRLADLRLALIDARGRILRLAHSRTSSRPTTEIHDLLANAAGHSRLDSRPILRVELEVLRAAFLVWRGDHALARACGVRARWTERRLQDEGDGNVQRATSRSDSWRRLGLSALRPATGRIEVGPREGRALRAITRALAREEHLGSGLERALEQLASALGGLSARIDVLGETGRARSLVRWRWSSSAAKKSRRRKNEPGDGREISAPLIVRGVIGGWLRVETLKDRELTGAAVALLESTADALAPHCTLPRDAESSPAEALLRKGRRDRSKRVTDSLERTRTLDALARRHRMAATARIDRGDWHADFVAESSALKDVLTQVRRLAEIDLPVLIVGESGTGKDHVARLLHRAGPRASYPFLTQNCSAIPAELLEADLFGFKKGAFSGADRTRTGFLFQAQGGTFHLEGIGDADLTIQNRLLHIIESRSVRPLGGTGNVSIDVRFVASTQRNLTNLVKRGEFRQDLFYRFSGGEIVVPPLRDHREDIVALAQFYSRSVPEGPVVLSREALSALEKHSWPGNVRELISVLRRLAIETDGDEIREADVARAIGPATKEEIFPGHLFANHAFDELQSRLEEAHLRFLHHKHGGDLRKIAAEMGKTTRSVYRRFERLGLKPKQLR